MSLSFISSSCAHCGAGGFGSASTSAAICTPAVPSSCDGRGCRVSSGWKALAQHCVTMPFLFPWLVPPERGWWGGGPDCSWGDEVQNPLFHFGPIWERSNPCDAGLSCAGWAQGWPSKINLNCLSSLFTTIIFPISQTSEIDVVTGKRMKKTSKSTDLSLKWGSDPLCSYYNKM